ncbi:MAG TPA: hypothetical protein VM536_15585 [Chloroflexia bacterium]|nr:hypothetical protein [Chloroflexia bacterium]
MNICCIVRPAPGWDKLRFNLVTGAVEVPADTALGLSAFGEGTWVLNPSDRAALDLAAGLAGADGAAGQITALALATEDPTAAEAALREALARGAMHAVLLTGLEEADSVVATGALSAAVRKVAAAAPVELVLLGAENPDGSPDEVGPMLAEALGWAGLTAARRLEALSLPAARPLVVSVQFDPAAQPRYAQARAVLGAYRERTMESMAHADLDLPDEAPRTPRVLVRRAALGDAPPAERLKDSVEESVAVLVQGLRQIGF